MPPESAELAAPASFRPTLGVLTAWSTDPYEDEILGGVFAAAREADVNIIRFVGEMLRPGGPGYEYAKGRNPILELVKATPRLDGLAVVSTTFSSSAGFGELLRVFAGVPSRPQLSLGIELASGAPCLLVDNTVGLREVVEHLIVVHGCRRLAFIAGPPQNSEALQRYQAYTEALAAHDLPVRPELVVPGRFLATEGENAIATLLDERRVEFDAVVGANDQMALGALRALQRRGFKVPEQVRVTGFDDIPAARIATPALTTVRQPCHQMGYQAVNLLLAQWRGEPTPQRVILPTQPVYRQSCGCGAPSAFPAMPIRAHIGGVPFETACVARQAEIGQALARALEPLAGSLEKDWAEHWLAALISDLRAESHGQAAALFETALRQALALADAEAWQQLLLVAQQRVLLAAADSPDMWTRALELWQGLSGTLGRLMLHRGAVERGRVGLAVDQMGLISQSLILCREPADLSRTLAEWLPRQGIERYGMCLYAGSEAALGLARLAIARGGTASGLLEPEDRRFPLADLWPRDLWTDASQRSDFMISALYFHETQLGYMVFDLTHARRNPLSLAALCQRWSAQISSTLQSIRQAEALEAAKAAAEAADRAKGAFLAVMGHELRTPLHVIFLTAEMLRGQNLTAADQTRYAEAILSSGNRLLHMVEGVLEYSSSAAPVVGPVNMDLILSDLTARFGPHAARRGVTLTFDLTAPLPRLKADALQLEHMLRRLLDNAVKFTPTGGRIVVTARHLPDWPFAGGSRPALEVTVFNSGPALAPADYQRIFEPFVQLESSYLEHAEGAGLGLTLARRQAEAHGGTLIAGPAPDGEGHCFTLRLPLAEPL